MNRTRGQKSPTNEKVEDTAKKVAKLLAESKTTFAEVNAVFEKAKSILVCDIL